jgi:hypothetical protein
MLVLHFWNKFLLGGFDEHMAFGGGKKELFAGITLDLLQYLHSFV